MKGVCLDALNPAGAPSMESLKNLGGTGHRLVLFPGDEFQAYYDALKKARFEVAVVLTGQSMNDGESIAAACTRYAKAINPDVWIIANEWNNIGGEASWPPGGSDGFVAVFQEAAPAIRHELPNAKLYVGGLFSEMGLRPEQRYVNTLQAVWPQVSANVNGIDLHPYLDEAEDVPTILDKVRDTFQTEVGVFEWNWMAPEKIGDFQKMLDVHTSHSCWFCWSDAMVDNHGLKSKAGGSKAVFHAFKGALSTST